MIVLTGDVARAGFWDPANTRLGRNNGSVALDFRAEKISQRKEGEIRLSPSIAKEKEKELKLRLRNFAASLKRTPPLPFFGRHSWTTFSLQPATPGTEHRIFSWTVSRSSFQGRALLESLVIRTCTAKVYFLSDTIGRNWHARQNRGSKMPVAACHVSMRKEKRLWQGCNNR